MSKIDLRNLLRAAKPSSFSKSTSIKKISMKTREMMKPFCQINQIFEDKENVAICEYYSNEQQQSYYRQIWPLHTTSQYDWRFKSSSQSAYSKSWYIMYFWKQDITKKLVTINLDILG